MSNKSTEKKRKIRKITLFEAQFAKKSLKEIKALKRNPVVLVCDNIRSLYNIGAMFRTCDALLFEKIVLCGISGAPPNKQIEKTALGTVKSVPFEYEEDVCGALEKLKKKGYSIIALEITENGENLFKADFECPVALIVGNEIDGISEKALKLCDKAIEIPMNGRANSLNVATAFAVAGYQIINKCQEKKSKLSS